MDPLLLIGAYVLDFLCIPPFLDGNGRNAGEIELLRRGRDAEWRKTFDQ